MRLDADTIKENLTIEDIVKILVDLGSGYPKNTSDEDILMFNTVCHNISGGKYKLSYVHSKKVFTCFTECSDSFNIYELVRRNKSLYGIEMEFYDTVRYVANLTGRHYGQKRRVGFGKPNFIIDDWDFIDGYDIRETQHTIYNPINTGYLNCFDEIYHQSWIDDGISIKTMKDNNIKYCNKDHQIIIPHYHGVTGDLIGIRCRNLVQKIVDEKLKQYIDDLLKPYTVELTYYTIEDLLFV